MLIAPLLAAASIAAAAPDIPRLDWVQRSDWANVRRDITPRAVGDGRADDTAALQAALDGAAKGTAAYLPPGAYRITRTLALNGPTLGALVVGHGRDTRVVWDGPAGGVMFRANGAPYSRYVGISWDGRGRAGVGVDHASAERFETEVRHEHEAFRGFTGCGIRVGHEQKVASAEILYRNCLFEDCGTGAAMLAFNDYDNTFDGCEFRRCGRGIHDDHGNFYARNCRFVESRDTDLWVHSEHGSSVRRCASRGSKRFLVEAGTIAPVTIQDCRVAAWKDPAGAVILNGSPVLLFDTAFSEPPAGAGPPVRFESAAQKLILSACRPVEPDALLGKGPHPGLTVIPPGRRAGVLNSADRSFLVTRVDVPRRILDARRDFGARADGVADDTDAVQAAIDAARKAGGGALAYLPAGKSVLTRTLRLSGSPFQFGGAGWRTGLVWRGAAGLPMIEVADAAGLVIGNMMVGGHDLGQMGHGDDIRVTASSGKPCRLTLDEVYAHGMYQKAPDRHGIRFANLPAGSFVDAVHVQGNLHIEGCADAVLLFRTSYEGTVTLSGRSGTGLVGFLTRLATVAGPTLRVRNNRSAVFSDFYGEQSDCHLLLEGSPADRPGAVTITGPKTHLFTQQPVIDLRGFSGRLFYGMNQFYIEPKEPRITATGSTRAAITIAGCFFYNTAPVFDLPTTVRLALIGNVGQADRGASAEALSDVAAALDDLRRLGEADLLGR